MKLTCYYSFFSQSLLRLVYFLCFDGLKQDQLCTFIKNTQPDICNEPRKIHGGRQLTIFVCREFLSLQKSNKMHYNL